MSSRSFSGRSEVAGAADAPGAGWGEVLSEEEAAAVRRGVPDPRIPLPSVAWPTVALWAVSLLAWIGGTTAVLAVLHGTASTWLLPVGVVGNAMVSFTMFTVLHEATHHAAGRRRWVNEALGRASMPFVAAWGTFPLIRYVHIEHHRHTNESELVDPDAWVEGGPWWQRPLRWAVLDLWYFRFYAPRMRRRPARELRGLAVNALVIAAVFAALIISGHGLSLLLVYLIPQRIGVAVLAWWFDWLPHHDLGVQARTDRFRATRVRVGTEWLMTPVMLYQNYHLVHHIHPTIPFYRYVHAWENTREDYLSRDVPIATAWGTELTAHEYRTWRGLVEDLHDHADSEAEEVRGQLPAGTTSASTFHRLRVVDVRALTDDAVAVTFEVPEHMTTTFAHHAGQHVTVRGWLPPVSDVDGGPDRGLEQVRRAYSVCSATGSGVLRIAVRHVAGGRFSRWATRDLRAGDTLEVATPAGRFGPNPAPGDRDARRVVAVAAGSGITPVLPLVATLLDREPHSRVTLLVGNRNGASTMFADEISVLVARADGRLRVVHAHSRRDDDSEVATRAAGVVGGAVSFDDVVPPGGASRAETVESGRVDLDRVLAHVPEPQRVDDWLLCGPTELLDDLADGLTSHGIAAGTVHREVFTTESRGPTSSSNVATSAATVAVTLGGETAEVECGPNETILDAALRAGLDAPYSCTGGGCGSCVAAVSTGGTHMTVRYALTDDEVEAGHILTCQARPTSVSIAVNYDLN